MGRLAHNEPLVETVSFKTVIIKVHRSEEDKLSSQDKKDISQLHMIQSQTRSCIEETAHLSFGQSVLKKQKLQKEEESLDHLDPRFILLTSILCERLF